MRYYVNRLARILLRTKQPAEQIGVMLKACDGTFSITKMPGFTVYAKCNPRRPRLDHGGKYGNVRLHGGCNPSEVRGAHHLPVRHR